MSTYIEGGAEAMRARTESKPVRRYTADLSAVGEPALWAFGGALALGVLLITGFLLAILWNGVSTFWPKPVEVVALKDGTKIAGEPSRVNLYRLEPNVLAAMSEEARAEIARKDGHVQRILYRTGNFDLYGEDFRWVSDFDVESSARPQDFFYLERQEWGPFIGRIKEIVVDGQSQAPDALGLDRIHREQREARDRFAEIRRIERSEIGAVNHHINQERLKLRRIELKQGAESEQYRAQSVVSGARIAELEKEFLALQSTANEVKARDQRYRIVLEDVSGRTKEMALSQVVRFYPANDMGVFEQIGVYFSRWFEFLTAEPREANTEGGILPAIFGTVVMTLLMVFVVAPFGVITALYLREYAKQGRLVAMVRIAVNNLAGVPSIVYGVFGLGFLAYTVGGGIDAVFFPERLPSPTFGTGGILWSALTLALLTVPVVIVASEEALSAVPRSIREGSLACGASKWQTIRSIVLPHALPGIMTGLILAMARGAGEVAPLMLVGVVKLAPELPVDGFFPFVHLERSFMHLGFHIFDVGFQSRNSEAGKPMVFVTTLLLLALIVAMNSFAIYIRNRLKRQFAGSQF